MCKVIEEYGDIRAKKETENNARSFYANGVSIDVIAKSLNMTQKKVREIVKDVVPVQA